MRDMSEDIQASGQLVRDEHGRFVAGVAQSPKPITHANARMLAAKSAEVRRRKATLAAQNRTVARLAAADPSIQTPYDAWGELVADQAEALRQAASEGKPRADDMMQVGRAMGMVAQVGERTAQDTGQATATLTLSADMVALLQAVASRQGADNYTYRNHDSVVDGQATDAEDTGTEADGEGGGGG